MKPEWQEIPQEESPLINQGLYHAKPSTLEGVRKTMRNNRNKLSYHLSKATELEEALEREKAIILQCLKQEKQLKTKLGLAVPVNHSKDISHGSDS
ncbi:MAG TPA: hypothetical protein VJB02_04410 [Coxiellaceae bacterium]|nr:hypothetical protein [Coxiellaceae bacterium]